MSMQKHRGVQVSQALLSWDHEKRPTKYKSSRGRVQGPITWTLAQRRHRIAKTIDPQRQNVQFPLTCDLEEFPKKNKPRSRAIQVQTPHRRAQVPLALTYAKLQGRHQMAKNYKKNQRDM
jgi:hypothetical protein